MKKYIFFLLIIVAAYGYYKYKNLNNEKIKNDIEFLIQKASVHSSESEKIVDHILKYEKASLGLAFLKLITNNYNPNQIQDLCKIDFNKFQKNINKNYLRAKLLLSKQCKLNNNQPSYLEDLSLKV